MARNFGTLQLADTLRQIDNANIMEYGLDNLYANVQILLQAHNAIMDDVMNFVETTDDRVRRYGTHAPNRGFQELDEYGAADVQKTAVSGVDVGFPLRKFGRGTGWTREYWEAKTPADFIKEMNTVLQDDVLNIQAQARRALFTSTNNLSYIDRFDTGTTLPVRALLNADGAAIPPDQWGNEFNGATHQHYLGTASLTAANVDATIDTVVEHGVMPGESIRIFINRGNEAAFTALTGFQYYERERITRGGGYTGDILEGGVRNDLKPDDVAIGLWDGYAEVWLKPWVPLNYVLVFLAGGEEGVLVRRRPIYRPAGMLRPVYEHNHHPLTAKEWERKIGFGVWQRHKAAILYIGNATYQNPTISMT